MESREKLIQCQARIAEIDYQIKSLFERRKRLQDWLSVQKTKIAQKTMPFLEDPAKKKIEYTKEFEKLWQEYPKRNGIRVEKKAAFNRFLKVPSEDLPKLRKAVENYARSKQAQEGKARDMFRFLKDDYWPAWEKNDNRSVKEIIKEVVYE
jgi:hypothetical protein